MKTKNLDIKQIPQPELLVSGAAGIYIPQTFARVYNVPEYFKNYSEIKEDLELLAAEGSQDTEDYWDIWDEVSSVAKMINEDGLEFYLWQNDDLWSVPKNYNNEDFFN
jgi:hypothetical protein